MAREQLTNAVRDQAGQGAYESDVLRCPTYRDGAPRRTWAELGDLERSSWCRGVKVGKV